ncbi:hypothetical protein I5I61_13675 [Pseudomonas nitroreducens]|uniref:DUF4760 domain-containing protein n=1 Tax=Pseudomonas nitroreducens TaxID=46680 RepID=A0ABS0KLI8_PSENT|nr:hypothetical protein [Pseudomonas nitroreducens]MBG6288496.1 hypothetical protein [Pseudomonas nitroreducens]
MQLGSSEITNLISYASLFISGILAIFYIRDRRHAKYTIENEYCSQLLDWHKATVEVLIALISRKDEEKGDLLIRLSVAIEQGRFFFPNIKPEAHGQEKPPAYRGYRNIALDFLVATYNLHRTPTTKATREKAIYLQRLYTSVVYEVVRPTDRLNTIRALTDKYFVKDISVDDLLDQKEIEVVSHIWDRPPRH